VGPGRRPQLPIDLGEVVPDGARADVEFGADLRIGTSRDEQLEGLGLAPREPCRDTARRRWGRGARDLRWRARPVALQQSLHQAFEPGSVHQQPATEVCRWVIMPTVRHAAHASVAHAGTEKGNCRVPPYGAR
jgi:hypothetical protein